MILSIHQPNFFPWLGFFNKINSSDVFIFLTESKRSKNDKYLTRSLILNNDSKKYLSIPLGPKQKIIKTLELPEGQKWRIDMLNILHASYSKSYFYEDVRGDIEELIMFDCQYFYEFSINVIYFFLKTLNIEKICFVDKDLDKKFGEANNRLVNLCNEVNASKYLSGIGAKSYIDEDIFLKNGIDIIYQDYFPRPYKQLSNEFIPGLSIIDVLFNCGYYETEKLIKYQ